MADLPPVMFPDKYAPLLQLPNHSTRPSRTTPLLDQVTSGSDAESMFAHRRSYQADLSGITIGIEALRLQSRAPDHAADRSEMTGRSKSWSIAARSDWRIGGNDQVSVGLAMTDEHSSQPRMLTADPHMVTSAKTFALTWTHDAQWRVSMGWQQTGGRSRGGANRMVELAAGAPLHETGVRFSLAFLPGGSSDTHRISMGVEARKESIASDDIVLTGTSRRQDMQASLFLRTHF
jgi:hypothetical protein